ncbi:uncharacterized protein LOC120128656 [Hibiscus syriacus]|uniref:uncharacterized protein LOC120128656 n=1 Tax=Hibiscus syriacus TaxID=106335 RepID=UPI0019246487|nr:uncharacterized protein LOC120128656 [Hibiscus syriacus]
MDDLSSHPSRHWWVQPHRRLTPSPPVATAASVGRPKPHFSWILNKLIKLREEARRLFISVSIWSQIKGGWIWDHIRDRRDKVGWHRLIWFPSHIPKFSIIAWMVILDRLPTKDRLARFGIVTVNVCGLCGDDQESQNHLFLECSFVRVIWKAILHACGLQLQMLTCWDDAMHWMTSNLKGKSLLVHILKLAWTGFVYFLWEERNRKHFRGVIRSADTIVNNIRESVRIKLYRCHMNKMDDVNRRLSLVWGLI